MTGHRPRKPLSVISLVAVATVCLLCASQGIWAAPNEGPLHQIVPTSLSLETIQPEAALTPEPASVPTEAPGVRDESATPAVKERLVRFTPSIPFRTPVYGISASSPDGQRVPHPKASTGLKDHFTKVFPIWCFWPIVGLILILAGMDLRARSHPKRK